MTRRRDGHRENLIKLSWAADDRPYDSRPAIILHLACSGGASPSPTTVLIYTYQDLWDDGVRNLKENLTMNPLIPYPSSLKLTTNH